MKCNNCGCEVRDDAKFCPICGVKLSESNAETVEAEVIDEQTKQPKKKQAKCWAIFAKIGKILGCLSFIPFVGLYTSEPGLIFSILGMQAYGEEAKGNSKTGLICSIIGFAINFVMVISIYMIYILFVVGIASGTFGEIFEEFVEEFNYYY